MILVGRSVVFLRGFDQASQVRRLELSRGDRILLKPEENWRHKDAIVATTPDGRHVGRVARELARPWRRLFASLRPRRIRHREHFLRFVYAEELSRYNDGLYTDTRVELEVLFYAEDQTSSLPHLTAICSHLCLDFVPVEEQPSEEKVGSKNKE